MEKFAAWLVVVDDEREIVESWTDVLESLEAQDLVSLAAWDMHPADVIHQVRELNEFEVDVVPLVLEADFDHGCRPADELELLLGQQAAYLVVWALVQGLTGRKANPSMFPGIDAAFTAATGMATFAGWIENSDDAQRLYEWSERMQAGCSSVGWLIESNADSGHTWFYRPVPQTV